MGRTRTGIVRESSDELRLLLERYRETVYEPRVRFLLSLREDPRAKAEVLMGELGLSERTIRRWWHDYQKGGLETFLDERATMVTTAMEPEATYDDEAAPLMEFLNALPTSCSLQEWRDDVERALAAYLHGVYRVEVDIWQLASEMPPHPAPSAEDLCVPVEIPIGGDERLGTLRFYRTEESDLNRTQEQINELYPFLGFLYTDAIARHRSTESSPDSYSIDLLTDPLARSLSPREREVLLHRLHGYTYAETAQSLGVSEETVRKYVKAIYRKTSTTSLGELFVRYFTALGDVSAAS